MIDAFKSKMKPIVQAYSASVAIMLGQLGYAFSSDSIREPHPIERVQPELPFGVFDPREVVARRIILTVPLSELQSAGERSTYSLN
jgi:hypothetical protein